MGEQEARTAAQYPDSRMCIVSAVVCPNDSTALFHIRAKATGTLTKTRQGPAKKFRAIPAVTDSTRVLDIPLKPSRNQAITQELPVTGRFLHAPCERREAILA